MPNEHNHDQDRRSLSEREWEACTKLVTSLQDEIRGLQQRGQLIAGVGLSGALIAANLVRHAPSFGLAITLLVVSLAFAWHLNLNAEVAAVAVYRDWIEDTLNSDPSMQSRPFRFKTVGEVGRQHPATIAAAGPAVAVLIMVAIAGVLSATRDIFPGGYHASTAIELPVVAISLIVSLLALAIAGLANKTYQRRAEAGMRLTP